MTNIEKFFYQKHSFDLAREYSGETLKKAAKAAALDEVPPDINNIDLVRKIKAKIWSAYGKDKSLFPLHTTDGVRAFIEAYYEEYPDITSAELASIFLQVVAGMDSFVLSNVPDREKWLILCSAVKASNYCSANK